MNLLCVDVLLLLNFCFVFEFALLRGTHLDGSLQRSLQANVVSGHLRVSTSDASAVDSVGALKTVRGQALNANLEHHLKETGVALGTYQGALPFDVGTEPAVLTCCHILESMAEDVSVTEPVLFQLNTVHVVAPSAGADVMTKDQSRLWFTTKVCDHTGVCMMGVTEDAALNLSNCQSQDEFMKQAASGVAFPLLVTARVVRSASWT